MTIYQAMMLRELALRPVYAAGAYVTAKEIRADARFAEAVFRAVM